MTKKLGAGCYVMGSSQDSLHKQIAGICIQCAWLDIPEAPAGRSPAGLQGICSRQVPTTSWRRQSMQGRGRQAGAANSQYANPVTILGNQWCACKRSRQSSNRHDLHKQLTVFGIRQQRSTPAKTKALWIFPRTGSADVYSSTRTASKSSRNPCDVARSAQCTAATGAQPKHKLC